MPSLSEMMGVIQHVKNQPSWGDVEGQIYQSALRPMAYDQAREAYEDQRSLKRLFAQSAGMPNIAEVGQYNPEMAIKLQQAQLDNLVKQQQMRESGVRTARTGQEIEQGKAKAFAEATGPFADQYQIDVQNGMPPEQALMKFRQGVGGALSQLEASGMSPDAPINMEQLTPDALLNAAVGHGYKSRFYEAQQAGEVEEARSQVPPRRTPEQVYGPAPSAQQVYGGTYETPYGPMRTPPIVTPQGQPFEVVGPEATDGMAEAPIQADDIDNLRKIYQSLPTGKEKDRAGKMLADAIKQQIPGRGQFVTPEQVAQAKQKEEEQKSALRVQEKQKETEIATAAIPEQEAAKAAAGRRETAQQKTSVLSSLPKVPEINALIDKSMSGQIEAIGKGKLLGEVAGIQTEALNASKELEIIASQMRQITKSLAGAGSVSDFEQRQMAEAAGNIADPRTPAETRKRQLKMFNRIVRKSLMQYPEMAEKVSKAQAGGEDDSVEAEAEEAPSIKRGSKPKIGQVESGYVFKGGDPSNPANWEKQ